MIIISVFYFCYIITRFEVWICIRNYVYQGSFWGAILRDSLIFLSKIALISLRCENSRNIDMEATRIELVSFRVDFVLFQWNLRHNSVWVNDTLLCWFSSVNWHKINFVFLWKQIHSPIGGAITAEFYHSSSPYYRYSYCYPPRKNRRHLLGQTPLKVVTEINRLVLS